MYAKRNKNQYAPVIDAELDLHGCTREEAQRETVSFLEDCITGNMERVRIIVGKGTHSPDGAVLPDVVKAILSQHNLSYSPAKLQDGGEGALEIRL